MSALAAQADRIIFVNCGMLGPLLDLNSPMGPGKYWAEQVVEQIQGGHVPGSTKMVGLTLSCGGKRGYVKAHVQVGGRPTPAKLFYYVGDSLTLLGNEHPIVVGTLRTYQIVSPARYAVLPFFHDAPSPLPPVRPLSFPV